MPRRRWPWILAFSIAIVAGGVIGLVVALRVKTGEWQAPSVELVTVALSDSPPAPSKIIYLNKEGASSDGYSLLVRPTSGRVEIHPERLNDFK